MSPTSSARASSARDDIETLQASASALAGAAIADGVRELETEMLADEDEDAAPSAVERGEAEKTNRTSVRADWCGESALDEDSLNATASALMGALVERGESCLCSGAPTSAALPHPRAERGESPARTTKPLYSDFPPPFDPNHLL